MSDHVSMAEAIDTLREVSLHSENADVQKHALDLLHDLSIFQELKYWSGDILRSRQNTANKAEAFVNLRVVGSMALKTTNPTRTVEEIGLEMGLLSSNLLDINGHAVASTPDLIEFTPKDDVFSKAKPSQTLPLIVRSPDSNPNQLYHASSPNPIRKSLTVSQATQQANFRRTSMDKGKEVERQHTHSESSESSDSNLLGLLHKSLNVPDVSAEPFAGPKPPVEEKKEPNWTKVGAWYIDLNDGETAEGSPFSKATNTIAKIMDMPTYGANLKDAEAAAKTNEEFDPTKDTPAAINALFATDPELANHLWGAPGEASTKSTILQAPTEIKVPALHAPPKRRKVSPLVGIPQITVTEALGEPATYADALRAGSGLHHLPSVSSIVNLQPTQPYQATLPLPPVPTHPQTFKYTPTVIPHFLSSPPHRAISRDVPISQGCIQTQEQEFDFDVFNDQFSAMLQQSKTPHTIPKTHDNPVIAAELALLHAQTILPRGCNLAYKEVCPCELSGRECPFKITCSLKRCYHKSEASHPGSGDWMHPTIRPTCVAWLRGDADCGHTEQEKANGEFGHEDRATRDWQGSDVRIRLHLAWNI